MGGKPRAQPVDTRPWDYCDRSPCARLLDALGRYVFGRPSTGEYVLTFMVRTKRGKPKVIPIHYCPFCGMRLSNLELFADGDVHVEASKKER